MKLVQTVTLAKNAEKSEATLAKTFQKDYGMSESSSQDAARILVRREGRSVDFMSLSDYLWYRAVRQDAVRVRIFKEEVKSA